MARCGFCGRTFTSSQGVRAHLRHCPSYKQQRPQAAVPSRAPRALTDKQQLDRLFGSIPSFTRSPAASTTRESQHDAPRPTPRPERDWAQEAHAAKQRQRAERTRGAIQQIKFLVIDCHFPSDPIPMEAIAQAKEEIERKLGTLPILDLPQWELQQHATAIRERIYSRYRQPPTQTSVAVPPRRDVTPSLIHPQPKESDMPIHRIVSGFFICPTCEEEYALDRTPEASANCPDCHVPLEELADDEEDDDGE